jgi:hypothetical protein
MGRSSFILGRSTCLNSARVSVAGWEYLVNVMVVRQRNPDLFQVAFALRSSRSFSSLLNGW